MEKNDNIYEEITEEKKEYKISRRSFIKMTGGGILLYFTLGNLSLFDWEENVLAQQMPSDFNAYLKIGTDGRVTLFTGKIEMGQGVVTSLGQMLADELDVVLENVDMVMGDTDLCPWDMGTFGSMSTPVFGTELRKAGAQARRVLLEMGAENLKVPLEDLEINNGVIFSSKNKNLKISYSELAKGNKIDRQPTGETEIKKPSELKIINKSYKRRDAIEKVTGKAKYTADIQLSRMLYAKILRPPAHNVKLLEADISEASQVEGVQVIREPDLIAVLHKYPDVAEFALSKIRAKYDNPEIKVDDKTIFEHLLKVAPEGQTVVKDGDINIGERDSKILFDETYYNDYVAHSPIEPHTAVASIENDKVTVWASTQTPFRAKDDVAKALDFQPENVRIITPFVGGGFGGKSRNLQVVEAARLAKLCGKPIQVAWTRKEEFFYDSFRPAAIIKIRSGISDEGKINLWDYNVYYAGDRGSKQFYNIPNHQTIAYGSGWTGVPGSHPFATGPWRAPGANSNTFARESQIDIMASKAGIDPLEFRLQNLTDKRMIRVLKTAADEFGWKPMKAPSGRGYGISCAIEVGTYVASIAEIEADKLTGKVKAKRVVCAQDMGLVINPEGATMQMEGCITMGLGYALSEGIHFKGEEVLDLNFDTYNIPRFSWLPEIKTILIDNKESEALGGGEPPIVNMGALIANAIYDAIGIRMFQLPMTPERIKEAIKKD
ncbi:MAG TPA: molybdopterin cofactor-binding domain-containing protein [Ignavibacteria bacterium]